VQIIQELLAADKHTPLPIPSDDLAKLKDDYQPAGLDLERILEQRSGKLEEEHRQQVGVRRRGAQPTRSVRTDSRHGRSWEVDREGTCN
jgi:hypothetical protein